VSLRPLRAGPVTAQLDGIDLRYVSVGPVEFVRRIYAAVRDPNWGTVLPELGAIDVDEQEDQFEVRFEARHRDPSIDFSWCGRITGDPSGRIVYDFDGRAAREMLYARIGICVHHPCRESGGRPFTARTPEGEITAKLPLLIEPQRFENGVYVPLFPSFDRLEVSLEAGGSVVYEFEGDLWETEDHRNWTDANLKTYSMPLALGFPHELAEGEALAQRVAISISGVPSPPKPLGEQVLLTLGEQVARFPAIGLGNAPDGKTLTPREEELLKALGPAHLRTDVRLAENDWLEHLWRAQANCLQLGCSLELALHLRTEDRPALAALASALENGPPTAHVLVILAFGATSTPEETTPGELVELVRSELADSVTGALFAGGTDFYFCELNRTRPDVDQMDAVFYAVMPQMHAFSDLDIVENLEAQADTVASARAIAARKPILVSPVTLRGRFAYKTASGVVEEDLSGGGLPDSVDPRQATQLGAAWTAGSLKYLAEAGADSVTYYEPTGWRGVIETEEGPPLPAFPSRPGQVFPLYHVLAKATKWRGAEVLRCESSRPLEAIGLGVRTDDGLRLLVANLGPSQLAVAVSSPQERERLLSLEPFETRVEIL
jgi:D-apionolactonase